MTKVTPYTTARLISDVAHKQSTVLNTDGSPSYAYQTGYLQSVVAELLDMLTEDQLRTTHQNFERRSERIRASEPQS